MGSSVSTEAFDYDAQLLSHKADYSVEVKADYKDDAAGPPHRRRDVVDGLVPDLLGGKTTWGLWSKGVEKYPDSPIFGTRKYIFEEKSDQPKKRGDFQWLTYKQANDRIQQIASGLLGLGLEKGDNVGIFSINRAEWVMTALAAYSQGMRAVALYDTLGDKAIEYIVNHAELKIVFVSKDTAPKLLAELENLKFLKYVVQFDASEDYGNTHETVSSAHVDKAAARDVKFLGLSQLLADGKAALKDFNPPEPDDLALIMYTSGTTGDPKGVMLSHRNIAATSTGMPGIVFGPEDRYISYLPLAHIFETVVQAFCWANGVQIGFFSGNTKFIMEDFNALQPSLLCGVPRVFERMYQKVMDGVKDKNCAIKYLFSSSYADQANHVRRGARNPGSDRILGKIKETLGMTKIRAVVSGGAPCPPYLFEFLKIIFGCYVGQGYGLTETAAALSIVIPDDYTVGNVGPPNCWAEIRLKSVPEMSYLVTDNPPRGEVQCRGAGVFKGYFKNEEATRETFDGEWFATGDVGRWNPNGTLSIIDRKKNIFKLSHGEYVAVEKVENVYKQCGLITQIFVYGNSFKSVLVAIVVPNADSIRKYAEEQGFWKAKNKFGTPEFAAEFKSAFEENRAKYTDLIEADLKTYEGPLKGFEKIKKIWCETEIDALGNGFTVENDTMTPTFKIRRPQLLKKYLKQIQDMYTAAGEPPKAEERWVK